MCVYKYANEASSTQYDLIWKHLQSRNWLRILVSFGWHSRASGDFLDISLFITAYIGERGRIKSCFYNLLYKIRPRLIHEQTLTADGYEAGQFVIYGPVVSGSRYEEETAV